MNIFIRILSTFSLISSVKTIFIGIKANNKYTFLNGLRSILCFWVVYCHTHMMGALPLNSSNSWSSTFYSQPPYYLMLEKNPVFIDTFFFIGGQLFLCSTNIWHVFPLKVWPHVRKCCSNWAELMASCTISNMPSTGSINIVHYHYANHCPLNRYLKMIPAVIGNILLFYLFPLIGNGRFSDTKT